LGGSGAKKKLFQGESETQNLSSAGEGGVQAVTPFRQGGKQKDPGLESNSLGRGTSNTRRRETTGIKNARVTDAQGALHMQGGNYPLSMAIANTKIWEIIHEIEYPNRKNQKTLIRRKKIERMKGTEKKDGQGRSAKGGGPQAGRGPYVKPGASVCETGGKEYLGEEIERAYWNPPSRRRSVQGLLWMVRRDY